MELIKRISLGVFVVAVILLAIIMGSLRLAISNIEYFKPEIVQSDTSYRECFDKPAR
jgi:hypothetical protein